MHSLTSTRKRLRAKFLGFSPNQPIIEFPTTFGATKGATPAQIALAWLVAQKPWIVPIPGTCNMDQLVKNRGVIKVELTPDDLCEIEAASPGSRSMVAA